MIALIAGPNRPPRSVQGLGLPYLAAVLEEAGFEARLFDLYPPAPDTDDPEALDQRFADFIAQQHPVIVGMTIHTPIYAERVRLAKFLRARMPDVLLIAGGHHSSAEPQHLLRHTDFDICVIGEGEETLREIARQVRQGAGRGRLDWLRSIAGVVYRQQNRIVRNPPRPPIADLDSLPFPAHHLLGLEDYAPHPNLGIKSTGLLTYRGCPKRCAFCLNPLGRRVRKRSPVKVAEEMQRVVSVFDVRGFNLYDNLFGLHRAHAQAVCDEIIARRLDVLWEAWTAGALVNADLAEKMRSAGCVRVGFGAESGDDAVLARAQRGFTTEEHLAGIRALTAAGVKVVAFFMIGLPGETKESVCRTIAFADRCGANEVCLSLHRPYPGTAVWSHPEAFGVHITRGPNFEAYIETEGLSRAAMLECAFQARDELVRRGRMEDDFLRCDRYTWESEPVSIPDAPE